MCDIISHRGPDDHGDFTHDNIGLGHRRLSIIDLASGHQPMASSDKRITVVFNGEIYNYLDLKKTLQSKGVSFNTNSDTEVIIELYRHYGRDCVKHLNGIFAFCIYDKQTKDIFLARDHAGIKPLYYINNNDYFIFASEIKSILNSGLVTAECNLNKVNEYFAFRQVAGPESLFKNINSLPPGSHASFQNNNLSITQYWDPTQVEIDETITYNDALDKLSQLLTKSIKMQMISDVPLGTFCSGGVDSSLITAIAAINSSKKINTYSIGFDEKEYDESKYARIVSDKYHTQHHELRLNNLEFSSLFEKSIWHNDLPLNFANSVLIYALSAHAKKSVSVVLTGEGADELFGGYPRYMIPVVHSKLNHAPLPLRKLMKYALNRFSDHKAKKLASFIGMNPDETFLYNSAAMSHQLMDKYSIPHIPANYKHRNSIIKNLRASHNHSAMNFVSLLDQQTYLISILNRQDKMSMAASIESRVPMLNYQLVEFANSLPASIKSKNLTPKHILKKLAEQYLPREVIYRKKSGFGVPLKDWFAADEGLGNIADDILTETSLAELEWTGSIREIISEHKSNKCDHSEILWSAINYVQWKTLFKVSV